MHTGKRISSGVLLSFGFLKKETEMQRIFKFMLVAVFSVAALAVSLIPGSISANASPEPANSQTLYLQNCARCHGSDGRANTPMGRTLEAADLTAPDVKAKSATSIERAIRNGRPDMPAFGKKLRPAQIRSIAIYVRSL